MFTLRRAEERGHANHGWPVKVLGELLRAGDGVALSDEALVRLEGTGGGEVLLFDLA